MMQVKSISLPKLNNLSPTLESIAFKLMIDTNDIQKQHIEKLKEKGYLTDE